MYILHLGYPGFPHGNATIKRILLTFQALKAGKYIPLIINKQNISRATYKRHANLYKGIPYVNTSLLLYRPDAFILRNLNKMMGLIGEFLLILKKRKKIKAAIFYHSSFFELSYYRLLSKIFGFKLIIHYVEYRSSIESRQSKIVHLNDLIFDNYSTYLVDGMIVISEFLKDHVKRRNSNIPCFKMPAICNFEEFDRKPTSHNERYMMYCGGIGYLNVIAFVIEVFKNLQERNTYKGKLLLAIGGGENEMIGFGKLNTIIEHNNLKDKVILMKDVSHDKLIDLYLKSELLIVPLRNVTQDIAGFHHKIGEYTASRKPIISTNLGEMKTYFRDGVSAILVDEYTVDAYTDKLGNSIEKEDLEAIGENGYQVGINFLNYQKYTSTLTDFIDTL